jgi:hypothetical protein
VNVRYRISLCCPGHFGKILRLVCTVIWILVGVGLQRTHRTQSDPGLFNGTALLMFTVVLQWPWPMREYLVWPLSALCSVFLLFLVHLLNLIYVRTHAVCTIYTL